MGKREIVWDLSEMFPSATDPSVHKALDDLTELAGNFMGKYQGKIALRGELTLLKLLREALFCRRSARIEILLSHTHV